MEGTPDLAALQARLAQFRDEREWARFHTPGNLAKAISVEAGELLEHFLWVAGEEEVAAVDARREEVEAELADVLIQCLNFAAATGVDVVEAVSRKIDLNEQRYPAEKARGTSAKYTEL